MKLIEYKQFGNIDEEKKLNKKKLAILGAIIAGILLVVLLIVIYACSSKFRNFLDTYLLVKNVSESSAPYLSIENEDNLYMYAYHDYVTVLKNNELKL